MKRLKNFFWRIFFAVAILQIIVILFQVVRYERILHFGSTLILEIKPIDPYDPFRGRYITLNFSNTLMEIDKEFNDEQKDFYVTFKNNGKFDLIDDIFDTPPKGKLYLKVKGNRYYNGNIKVEYPFQMFYMQENFAKYVDHNGMHFSKRDTMAKVKVLDGAGVIEDVVIDSVPIIEFIKERLKEENSREGIP